jgi:hypothetical protein
VEGSVAAFLVIELAIPVNTIPWKGITASQYNRPPKPWGKKIAL